MRQEIIKFVKKVCEAYGLQAFWIPDGDIYCIHRRGLPIQNFTSKQFLEIPSAMRFKDIRGIFKRGLNHNLGEGRSLGHEKKYGQRIV